MADTTRIDLDRVAAALDGEALPPPAPDNVAKFPSRPPFVFKMLDAISVEQRKEWLAKGMLGAGDFSILYGDPGCGKSVLATDLAFHVAAGMPWHGRAVRKGAVLYVAAERAALTERRMAALRARHGMAKAPLAILDGHFDLFSSREDALRLIATVDKLRDEAGIPVVLVVIDTVARVIPGADENHARDMGRFTAHVDLLRRATGAHVMAIHHAGKDKGKGMRGSTALLGAADTTVFVEKLENNRFATVDKSNDEGEGETISFDLEGVNLFTDPVTGDSTSAPIVVPVADAKAPKSTGRFLSTLDRIALDCLNDAMSDYGRDRPPDNPDIPPCVDRVVDERHWRKLLYSKTKEPGESESSARQRFRRVKAKLVADKKIGAAEDYIWPTR